MERQRERERDVFCLLYAFLLISLISSFLIGGLSGERIDEDRKMERAGDFALDLDVTKLLPHINK